MESQATYISLFFWFDIHDKCSLLQSIFTIYEGRNRPTYSVTVLSMKAFSWQF